MIEIHPQPSGAPSAEAWRFGLAVGRAYELLRAETQSHVRAIQERVGFRYCRFHGLFHDDMQVVIRDASGKLRFQWSQVGKAFDFLLSVGLKPFVELNPMPLALASGDTTFFYWRMNVTPPADWEEWELLIESFVTWARRRYGAEEVRSWFFEVWNEPNLDAFWSGTKEQYFELYHRSVTALHRVDPTLRIGGPASAEGGWIDDFLASANHSDFISTHIYPMNEFATFATRKESTFTRGKYMIERLQFIRRQVESRPLYITEWNSLDAPDRDSVDWFDNPTIDSIASGAVTLRMATELDGVVDGLFWWVASDIFEEAGLPQSPFSGTYGMLTIDGIPKPSMHAFTILAALRGDLCSLSGEIPDGVGIHARAEAECTRAAIWNHVIAGGDPLRHTVSLRSPVSGGPGLISLWHVQPGRGSAYEVWLDMGRPQNPTPVQLETLRNAAVPHSKSWQTNDLSEAIQIDLGPNEIALVEWAPVGDPYIPKEILSEQSLAWNNALAAVKPLTGEMR